MIISWICVRDIAIIAFIVKETDRTEGLPCLACILEDRNADRDYGGGSNARNAAVETRICGADGGDCHFA